MTDYKITKVQLEEAQLAIPNIEFRLPINQPTGNFFYDPWIIKDEFKNTIWEDILNTIPEAKGEARIIKLDPGTCYRSHADIDDRYHLNILGEECYLIDLMQEQLHRLEQDGHWYSMNAGWRHTATNFGRCARIQLVVRQLLKKNKLINPIEIVLSTTISNTDDARFMFDNTLSPWFNEANKLGFINNFDHSPISIKFNIEKDKLESFKNILPTEFKII
jgi:hypothetical protein